jgi:predicted component of type VI protein secretion system
MAPLFEFVGGQRAPYNINSRELVIGRAADCGLRVESDTTADRHARLTIDAAGKVYIQDLDTQTGTLRNGNYVYGVQQLDDGDRIEIGGVALLFRTAGAATSAASAFTPASAPPPSVAPAGAAPPAARRAGAEERTRMPVELPPEVRALLAARDAQSQAAHSPPPPVQAAPTGVVVGTPEPEPDNFRTVQMQAPDLAALGIDPASLPGGKQQPTPAKRTMMGMGVPPVGKPELGYMATTQLPAMNLPPQPKAPPQQATMMAAAPVITQQPFPKGPQYEGDFTPPSHQPAQYPPPSHQICNTSRRPRISSRRSRRASRRRWARVRRRRRRCRRSCRSRCPTKRRRRPTRCRTPPSSPTRRRRRRACSAPSRARSPSWGRSSASPGSTRRS